MEIILTVVGARPQFVKAGPVSRALAAAGIREVILHTGQHYDPSLSDVFFRDLELPVPHHHLGVGSGPHGEQTAAMLKGIEDILVRERPAALLVYGDTNSTLAGALAAAKLHVPVLHVEAGLRSRNRHMPEEVNRVLTDHTSAMLFAPTATAVENLVQEGFHCHVAGEKHLDWTRDQRVFLIGDVMVDALEFYRSSEKVKKAAVTLPELPPRGYYLATMHRPQNTDDPVVLGAWLEALGSAGLPVLLPLHPRTRTLVAKHGLARRMGPGLVIVEPLGYFAMLAAQTHAAAVLTDSGGVQKEAYMLGVPCVTLRPETEWVETLVDGWNRLCPHPEGLHAALQGLRDGGKPPAAFGDGTASMQLARIISENL